MASENLALTTTPVDIYDALSLEAGKRYTVQNGGDRRAYFWQADTQPDISAIAAPLFMEPGAFGTVSDNDGKMWFWADDPTVLAIIGMA